MSKHTTIKATPKTLASWLILQHKKHGGGYALTPEQMAKYHLGSPTFLEFSEYIKATNAYMKPDGLGTLFRPNDKLVPKYWSVFRVGESVVLKDYTFKVAYIGETAILLEPLGVVQINVNEEDE